ncbi:MAG: hypothetical protein R3D81_11030 [Thalassovita sp.]
MSAQICSWCNDLRHLDRLLARNGRFTDLITFTLDRPGHDARYAIDLHAHPHRAGLLSSVTAQEGQNRPRWHSDNESGVSLLNRQGVGQRLAGHAMTGLLALAAPAMARELQQPSRFWPWGAMY